MPKLPRLVSAALIALAGAATLSTAALADHRGYRWNGPEGHFVVDARLCPDLREDVRDRRHGDRHRYGHYDRYDRYDRYGRGWYGYGDHRSERRDRAVLACPSHAWDYVPSWSERRSGRYHYGERLDPSHAYFDRRTGRYMVQTRWGYVPVEIDWSGLSRGYRSSGFSLDLRF